MQTPLPATKPIAEGETNQPAQDAERQLQERLRQIESLLPEEDGIPVENFLHLIQQELLRKSLRYHWRDRTDYFIGTNTFLYYSLEQAERMIEGDFTGFRGPDFFVVIGGVDGTQPRRYWVTWKEDNRFPNVVVEILSPSTARQDRGEKMQIYAKEMRVPEYFLIDWDKKVLEGYELQEGTYVPMKPNARGWFWSKQLGLWLGAWDGKYDVYEARWFRFYTESGELVLTAEEAFAQQYEVERQRAEAERQRAEQAEAELQRLKSILAERGMQVDE